MKKIVGALLLGLTLLGPAHFALAASNDEKILMRLDRLDKQIQMLQSTVRVRMAEGKTMAGGQMKDVMKMIEAIEKAIKTAADWFDQE